MQRKSVLKQNSSRCAVAFFNLDLIAPSKIHKNLLRWFKKNGRDLPWKKTQNPYAIWVSEIMLQQTQVDTVIPYYRKFLKSFPTVRHLAHADLSEVLKVWEGLGYYSRARNLHRASQIILNHFQGKISDTLEDLLSLPGIGRSTAGAILSLAYNKEAPILDGNVKRVLSRLFAISGDPKERKTEKILWHLSESLIPKSHANAFNQALMDLGSMVCTSKNPQCLHCPLHHLCKGEASGKPERYPTKTVKKSVPSFNAVSAVIEKNGKVFLDQRPLKGFLGGLWEFPNWRTMEDKNLKGWLRNQTKKEFDGSFKIDGFIGTFRQIYSHFKLTLHVYHGVLTDKRVGHKREGRWVPIRKLYLFPMSRIHRRISEVIDGEIGR